MSHRFSASNQFYVVFFTDHDIDRYRNIFHKDSITKHPKTKEERQKKLKLPLYE